jgi:hypothetical protein
MSFSQFAISSSASRSKAALVLAGLVAAAGVSAPAAAATTCRDTGGATICQTNGSVSIKARPTTTVPPANQPVGGLQWLLAVAD